MLPGSQQYEWKGPLSLAEEHNNYLLSEENESASSSHQDIDKNHPFTGFIIDSITMTVDPTSVKITKIIHTSQGLLQFPHHAVREVASILGLLISIFFRQQRTAIWHNLVNFWPLVTCFNSSPSKNHLASTQMYRTDCVPKQQRQVYSHMDAE